MTKTIQIGDKEVVFKSSAALPRIYRKKFNRDMFVVMTHIMSKMNKNGKINLDADMMEAFEDLAYSFVKYGDPVGVPDNIEEWLEQFETMDIFAIIPAMLELWAGENKTTGTLKKKNDK